MRGHRGLFFSSVLIIRDGMGKTCHADVVWFQLVEWFGGLTYDFWAENGKRKCGARILNAFVEFVRWDFC
jgi:hypothetical protein